MKYLLLIFILTGCCDPLKYVCSKAGVEYIKSMSNGDIELHVDKNGKPVICEYQGDEK